MSVQSMQRSGTLKSDNDHIRVVQTGVKMLVIAALAFWLNFFPERVGYLVSARDFSSFMPILTPEFQVYLPWLNLWWSLAFSLHVINLATLRWNPFTRWLDLVLRLVALPILGWMAIGPPISDDPLARGLIQALLIVAIIITTIAAVRMLNRLLGRRRFKHERLILN